MGPEVMVISLHPSVIPAKAGIHNRRRGGSFDAQSLWIPAFAGMTGLSL